jgi:hypothetical protein
MARDEMRMITEDKWDEDIWGVKSYNQDQDSKFEVPRLIFYFGHNVSVTVFVAARGEN